MASNAPAQVRELRAHADAGRHGLPLHGEVMETDADRA